MMMRGKYHTTDNLGLSPRLTRRYDRYSPAVERVVSIGFRGLPPHFLQEIKK